MRGQMIKKYNIHILPIKHLVIENISQYVPNQIALIVSTSCCDSFSHTVMYGKSVSTVLPSFAHYLVLSYQDISNPDAMDVFDRIKADDVRRFISSMDESVTELYICCDSGESRSPAMAAALLLASERSDRPIWLNHHYHPNPLVFRELCRGYGIPQPNVLISAKTFLNRKAYKLAQLKRGKAKYKLWEILK